MSFKDKDQTYELSLFIFIKVSLNPVTLLQDKGEIILRRLGIPNYNNIFIN